MAFLVVISSPAKIRMLLLSTTHSARRPSTQSRVSHARIPFFVSAREAKLVLTEKSQVIRLSRFARLQGRKGRWGGGYKKLAESQPSEEREQEICHSGVDTESHENVIHFGAAGRTEGAVGARCTPIASCCLSWFGRFTSQTFPLPALPVGGVLSRKDNTEKLHRAQTRVESDTLEN